MTLSDIVSSKLFLNAAIGVCGIMVLVLPLFTTYKINNREPKRLRIKNKRKRVNPILYFMIVFFFIGVGATIIKDDLISDTLKLATGDKRDILKAIRIAGYKLTNDGKRIIDTVDRICTIIYKGRKIGEPRISTNGFYPLFTDTGFNKKDNKIIFRFTNTGSSTAFHVKLYFLIINTKDKFHGLQPNNSTTFDAIEPGITQQATQEFKLSSPITDRDTFYFIPKITYFDSLGRSIAPLYKYYIYIKSQGLELNGASDRIEGEMKAFQKRHHY
jgi:hypothetical protein